MKLPARDGDELPAVVSRPQAQFQHPKSVEVAHFAVRKGRAERCVASTSSSHYNLDNAKLSIGVPIGILRCKPLVGMLVPGEDHVNMRFIKRLPERPQFGMNGMLGVVHPAKTGHLT